MQKTKSQFQRSVAIAVSMFLIQSIINRAHAQDSITVLFIGNSMTYVHDLPGLLSNLASANGKTIITAQNTPGGYFLSDHVSNPASLSLMAQGFDYIVVQEQSAGNIQPALPSPGITRPIAVIDSIAKVHCSKLLLYPTPGYPETYSGSVYTYPEMQSNIIHNYSLAAHSVRAACLPTAHAFRAIVTNNPGITGMWFSPNDYHPGIKGQYLHACVLYSVLYNQPALGSPAPPGISVEDAIMLQQTAWNQVKDSAYVRGYYKLNQLHTDFSITYNHLNVAITDSSSGMINKKLIHWGDGDSLFVIPAIFQDFNTATHNYAQEGNYTITQKVWWSACDSAEVIQNVSLPLSNNKTDDNRNLLTFYPNPTSNLITFKSNNGSFEYDQIQILDTQGRLILSRQINMHNDALTIDVSDLPDQLLLIKLIDKNGSQQTIKIMKEQ